MNASVALVLDPDFGDRLVALAQKMPTWVLSSRANDSAVHVARAKFGTDRITILRERPREGPEKLLARALHAIDEHHGEVSESIPYDTLWVHGRVVMPPQDLASELGFKSITATADGFKAEK